MEEGFFSKDEIKQLENLQFCSEHECTKEKLRALSEEKRFWHRLLGSKWFFWISTGLIVLLFGFIGWTVNEIYAQKANEKENKKAIATVCEKVQEIKEEVKDIKEEIKNDQKERTAQREKDQERLMRILLEIKKEVKK